MNRIDRTPACPEFLEVFSDFVDGSLSRDRESDIRAHLDCCEGCLRHLAAYRRGVMALKACERDVEPAAFWTELERRLWTEGHLAGGRREEPGASARWRHPALAVAAAACFAVVVFFAGLWGDRLLDDARTADGVRSVVTTASISGPVVLESEPIEIPPALIANEPAPAPRRASAARAGGAPIVRAGLEIDPVPVATGGEEDPVEAIAEAAYVASLEREVAAWEAIERTRARALREGLRRALDRSEMTSDGWVAPVRLGTAGARTLRARAPVSAWPVEAALSIP